MEMFFLVNHIKYDRPQSNAVVFLRFKLETLGVSIYCTALILNIKTGRKILVSSNPLLIPF